MQTPQPGNKYIVGWVTLRDGSQAAFDKILGPYVQACRAEPECRFFEMIRTHEDPLTVLVCECFLSEEAHGIHCKQPHFKRFWEELHTIALAGRFENVIAGAINPDAYDFSTGQPI
jgi:quinol monooxygenase YgiN